MIKHSHDTVNMIHCITLVPIIISTCDGEVVIYIHITSLRHSEAKLVHHFEVMVMSMVLSSSFNNIPIISWWSVLLVE
jgi:hypothetical protein